MKRIFILLAAVAVVAAGCKNYDDRFDNLNDQIKTLTSQVTTLQGVASQVKAIDTEIKNIRQSIQGDIQTAVAGVSTTLGNNLQTAQTALNAEITKLQTALNQADANSLSQEDIDKLKSELQTTLAAAQKTALDTALASLQAKLTELERALADAANDALAQADLDQLREEIESELAEVKKDLEESLGDGGFYQGDTTIRSSREWDNTKRGQADYTAFSGDVTINTTNLEASEVDELIDWVGKITVINGDLTIIHAGSEKVVKLAQLSSVGDLDDSQLHVHYPELISAGTITLDDDIKTVKLPKLTTLEAFAGHTIDLDKGTELTLTALASYDADLKIDLDGTGAVIDLSALKVLGKADLTIIGPDEVSLPELTTLALLHVKDVRTVTAPKVKAANLRISEDVVSVNVGTEAGAHINTLTFTEANDLETLQIGGNPAAANKGGTVVALNAGTTPDLERAHIHGGFSVVVNGLDDFEEIITARTITSEVSLIGTALEGDVALGHASGANGILTVEHNTDIESLKADKVNKLKGLYIKGNHDLEEVSFDSFKVPGKQTIGGQNWWDGDGFAIGKAGYGAYNDSDDNLNDNKNNLIAKEITQEILKSDKSVDRAGNIVDETGLSDLVDVLKHADTKRAVISFDGTEAFKGQSKTAEAVELQTTEANHEHLILFRKGTADIEGTKAGAKRVFLVNEINGLNLTIGVGGTGFTSFSRPINLSEGGSVKNWVNEINDDEVKDFFDTNDVEINAEVGGNPKGLIRFKNIADGDNLTGTNTGTIKLTIGKGTGAYSNTVTLFDVDDDTSTETTDDDKLPDPEPFSSDNKKAITYVDSNSDRLLEDIAETLISAFPPFFESDGTTIAEDEQRPDVAAHVPYGVSNLHDAGGDEDEDETYTAIVGVFDAQRIAANIDVKIDNKIKGGNAGTILKVASGKNAKIRQVNIKNDPNTIQITLTSKVAGEDETTIGVPVEETDSDEEDFALPTPPNFIDDDTGGATVFGTGTIVELPIGDDNPRKSSLPKAGTDDAGAQTRGGAEFDRLGWL